MKYPKRSLALKAAWAKPGVREKWREGLRNSPTRAASLRKLWRKRGKRKLWAEAIRKSLNRPEVRRKISKSLKIVLNTPEVKAKRAAYLKAHWSDPKARARHIRAIRKTTSSPEWLQGQKERNGGYLQKHQNKIRRRLENEGWEILRGGWPDFICLKNGQVRFIEAKSPRGKLTPLQKKVYALLETFGMNIEVAHK
jgi:VRR-NUC domain